VLTVRVGEHDVHTRVPAAAGVAIGDRVGLVFKRYHVFDRASGARLESVVATEP
jgi:hypothetical protein